MGKFISNIDKIKAATKSHISVVHHAGKSLDRGARGHSSLKASADTEIELSREKNGDVTTVRVTKQREYEKCSDLAFKIIPIELGIDDRGRAITSCVVEYCEPIRVKKKRIPSGKNQKILFKELQNLSINAELKTIAQFGNVKCVTEDALRDAAYRRLSGETRFKSTAFNRALDALVADEFAWREDQFVWLISTK